MKKSVYVATYAGMDVLLNRTDGAFAVCGKIIAENIDTIEKKPFFHVYPWSRSNFIAAAGYNFNWEFCQNHKISQMPRCTLMILGEDIPPAEIMARANKSWSKTIVYAYAEPTVCFEFAYETARFAERQDMKNVFVTNGFITSSALETISPYWAAANVDLKSFRDEFYRKSWGARFGPALESLQKIQ